MLGLGNILTKGGALLGFPNKYSFNFDGSNDDLEIENGDIPSGDESRTISAWINADVLSGDQGLVFTGTFNTNQQFTLAFLSSNANKLSVWGYSNDFTGTTTLSTGTWYHIVAVYDSSASNLKTYINGTVDINTTVSTNFNTTFGKTIIGARDGGSYFNGKIDEVAIWNTALSSDDVAKIASKPVDFSKASTYATDRTSNLKLWLRAGDKVEPETSIARSDFYTEFDGTDDYVSVADNDDLSFGDGSSDLPFSISAWINPVDATNFTIVSKGVYNTDAEYLFQIDGTDKLFFSLYDESVDSTYEGAYFNTALTSYQGSWFHVCATYNGVGGTSANAGIKLYIDGAEKSTTTIGGGTYVAMENLGGELEIGRAFGTCADGKISNLALHQTILDAQTISQMAKSRFTPMRDNRFSVVDFDGTNDYIALDSDISLTGEFTFNFWLSTNTSGTSYLVSKGSPENWIRFDSASSNARLAINGTSSSYITSLSTPSDGSWFYFSITRDSSNVITAYVDGVQDGNTITQSGTFTINEIGRFSSVEFAGQMGNVTVYSTAKSAEEIYAIYQQGITYDESSLSGLQGYWRMGDDTSKAYPTIADSSSNSNDGTITNGASDDIVQQMVAGYDMGAFESSSEELQLLVTTGDWTLSGSWVYDSSTGYYTNTYTNGTDTPVGNILSSPATTVGKVYKLSYTVVSTTGSPTLKFPNNMLGLSSADIPYTVGETNVHYGVDGGSNENIGVRSATGVGTIVLKDVKFEEVLQSDLSDTYPAIIDVNEPIAQERVTNTDFNNTSGWSDGSGRWTIDTSAGTATHDGSANFSPYLSQSNIFDDANALYEMTITIDSCENFASAGIVKNGSVSSFSGGFGISSTGTHTVHFTNSTSGLSIFSNGIVTVISHVSIKKLLGNVGTMTNQDSADLVYSSVLPDQSFLTGVNSAYNFIDLDGIDASVDIGSSINNAFTGSSTISLWMETDVGIGTQQTFIGAYNSDVTDLLHFYKESSGKITAMYEANNIRGTATTDDVIFVSGQNDWKHIVCTINDTTNQINIYVNGNLQTLDSTINGDLSNVTNSNFDLDVSLTIGARNENGTPARFFNGSINQFAIWNKSLSSTEISAIYTAGRHTNLLDSYSDNLKGYYAFGALDAVTGLADTDSTIYDRSGNSNHGTTSGTATGDLKSPPNAEPNGYAKGGTNRSTTTP